MIILDYNQVMIAKIMEEYGKHIDETPLEINIFRSCVLNTIRNLNVKFRSQYGELIIATDGKRSWRKEVFAPYKANRKKSRDTSKIDWSLIFSSLSTVREEIKDFFPYRVINVDGAEADDVIGTLSTDAALKPDKYTNRNILILSGDKDFIQLQKHRNTVKIDQYDPVKKKFITSDDPILFMKEHLIKGDVGDGIPNFLSPDNSFVDSIRQKSITTKNLQVWLAHSIPEDFCTEETLRNYRRNEQLIDLEFTPVEIKRKIIEEYESQADKDRSKMFSFMIKNRLKVLTESITDF